MLEMKVRTCTIHETQGRWYIRGPRGEGDARVYLVSLYVRLRQVCSAIVKGIVAAPGRACAKRLIFLVRESYVKSPNVIHSRASDAPSE